jgi:hypothetical protein
MKSWKRLRGGMMIRLSVWYSNLRTAVRDASVSGVEHMNSGQNGQSALTDQNDKTDNLDRTDQSAQTDNLDATCKSNPTTNQSQMLKTILSTQSLSKVYRTTQTA